MFLDLWSIPSALLTVWGLRGAIIAGLALTFLSTVLEGFQRLYTCIILAAAAVMGAGVSGMIYVAQPNDVAIHTYQGGLILIIMGIFTLTHVRLYASTAVAVVLTVTYAGIVLLVHDYHREQKIVVLIGHLFMFVSITIIGITAQVLRDTYSRENYLLRHSLQRDVEIKEEEKRRASYLAEHDPLTGLANRLRFDKDANAMLDRARACRAQVQILFLDLDSFKPVNDAHGHAVGDRVLKVVAERLRRSVQPHGVAARVGGDEFVVALSVASSDTHMGTAAAEKIASALAEGIELRGQVLHLTASIGVASFPADGDDLESVLRAADTQMYAVKNRGRGGIAVTAGCEPARLTG